MQRPTIIFAVILLLAAGCTKREGRAARGSREGILYLANGAEPADLDPQTTVGVPESHLEYALFEGLIDFDKDDPTCTKVVPAVAERWEFSADHLTYTFHLRANAKWSNGEPVTARDFLESYRRVLTPTLGAQYADMLYVVAGAEEFHQGRTTDFAQVGVRAPDDRTLTITLKQPTPFFLLMLKHHAWLPVPIATLKKLGPPDSKTNPWTRPENLVSNGPFRLKEWKPQQEIVVARNPQYWDAAAVRLKEIHFYPIEDLDAEERSFRGGDLHGTENIPLAKIDTYRREHPEQLVIAPFYGSYFLRVNVTRPPLNDPRVRRALAMAMDRESIVKNITRADQQPAYTFVPPSGAYQPPDAAKIPRDLEAARKLLAEAGYPDGKGLPKIPILFNTLESHRAIAESVQQMWRQNLGVEAELSNQEFKVYLNSMNQLDYALARSGWIGDYNDPYTFLSIMRSDSGNNNTGWKNAEYDRLLDESLATSDPAARLAILQKAETVLMNDAPLVPIYFYTRDHLQSVQVRNKEPNILDLTYWKHVYLDPNAKTVPPERSSIVAPKSKISDRATGVTTPGQG